MERLQLQRKGVLRTNDALPQSKTLLDKAMVVPIRTDLQLPSQWRFVLFCARVSTVDEHTPANSYRWQSSLFQYPLVHHGAVRYVETGRQSTAGSNPFNLS